MNSNLLREFGDSIFQLQQRLTDEDSIINLVVKKINDLESKDWGKIPRELAKLKRDLLNFQNCSIRETLIKQLREIAGSFENKERDISPMKIESEMSASLAPINTRFSHRQRPGRGNYKIATEEDKKLAIEIAHTKGLRDAAQETGFPAKNIKRWLDTGPLRKKGGGRKTLDPAMELKLHKWILEQEQETKQPLTRSQIKRKAKEMSTVSSFKASKGWLDKFRRRYNIQFRPAVSDRQFDESESSIGKFEESNLGDDDENKENEDPVGASEYIEQGYSPFKQEQGKNCQGFDDSPYQKRSSKACDDYQDFLSFSSEKNVYDIRMSLEQNFYVNVKEDESNV